MLAIGWLMMPLLTVSVFMVSIAIFSSWIAEFIGYWWFVRRFYCIFIITRLHETINEIQVLFTDIMYLFNAKDFASFCHGELQSDHWYWWNLFVFPVMSVLFPCDVCNCRFLLMFQMLLLLLHHISAFKICQWQLTKSRMRSVAIEVMELMSQPYLLAERWPFQLKSSQLKTTRSPTVLVSNLQLKGLGL